jgi:hypothetical protein
MTRLFPAVEGSLSLPLATVVNERLSPQLLGGIYPERGIFCQDISVEVYMEARRNDDENG